MYVIMRHDDYLQTNGSFVRDIIEVRFFCQRPLADRIAEKLNAEVFSISDLVRKRVWTNVHSKQEQIYAHD